jgi:hypothetical protein
MIFNFGKKVIAKEQFILPHKYTLSVLWLNYHSILADSFMYIPILQVANVDGFFLNLIQCLISVRECLDVELGEN